MQPSALRKPFCFLRHICSVLIILQISIGNLPIVPLIPRALAQTTSQHVSLLTISSAMTSEDLTNFPLLLRSENLPEDVFEKAQSNGGDVQFTSDQEGKNVLPLEIVSFSKEQTELWVRVPQISANEDTKLYVWYGGNETQADNAADVWDVFDAVVHGESNPTSGTDAIKDSSKNGHHFSPIYIPRIGKPWGSANHVDSKIGKGYAVSGSNGFRYIQNRSLPSIASSHPTISFWWKQGNIRSGDRFSSLFYVNAADQGLDYSISNYNGQYLPNQFTFREGNRNSGPFPNQKPLADIKDQWRHIAVTYQNGNQALLYIDGELFSTSNRSYGSYTSAGLRPLVGQRWPTASIDELRFRAGGSNAAWVKAEFLNQSDASLITVSDANTEDNNTQPSGTNDDTQQSNSDTNTQQPPTPANVELLPVDGNTIALWRMNGEQAGSEQKNSNAQGQSSRVLIGGNGLQAAEGLFGDTHGAYQFNSTESLQVNNVHGGVYGKNTTIEAWVYLDANNVRHRIYNDWDWIPHKFIVLNVEADGTLSALRGKHENHAVIVKGSTVLQPKTWYYVAATFAEGQKGKLYVNGSLDGESTEILDKANVETSTYNGAQIAGYNYHGSKGTSFKGRIDEIRISNKTRSDKEIATIYKDVLENTKLVSEESGPPAWIQVQEYKEEPGMFVTTKDQIFYYFGVPEDLLTKIYSKHETGVVYGDRYTIQGTHDDARSNMKIEFRTPGNYGRTVASTSFYAEYTKRKGSIDTWDFKSAHGHGFIPLSDRIADRALFSALVLPEETKNNPTLLRGIQFIHAIQNTENGTKDAVTPTFRAEIKEGELKLFSTNLPAGFVAALRDKTEVIAISDSADENGVLSVLYKNDLNDPNIVLLDEASGQQVGPALSITKGNVPYVQPTRVHLTQLAYNPQTYVELLNTYDQEHFKTLSATQRQLTDGVVDLFLAKQNSASFPLPWTTGSVFVNASTLPSGVTASIADGNLTITAENPTVPNFKLELTLKTGTTERIREVLVRLITADVSLTDLNAAVEASKEAGTEQERRLAGAQAAAYADLLQRTSSVPMQRGRLYIEAIDRDAGTIDLRLRSTEDKSVAKLGSNTTTVNHNGGTDFHRLTLNGLPTDETTLTLYAPDGTTVLDLITIDATDEILYNQTPWDRIEPGLSVASVHNGAVLVVLSNPDDTSTITGGVHTRTFTHANGTAFTAGIVLLDQRSGDTHTLQLQSGGTTYDSVTLTKQSDGTFAVEVDAAWQQQIIKTEPVDRLSPPATLEESLKQDLQDAVTLKRMQARVSELVTAITLHTAEPVDAIGPHYNTTGIVRAVKEYLHRELYSPASMGDEELLEQFYSEYPQYCPTERCPNGENIETAVERAYQQEVLRNGNKQEGVDKNRIRTDLVAKGQKAFNGERGYRERYWEAYDNWQEKTAGEAQHRLTLLLLTRNHNTTDGYHQGNFDVSSAPYRATLSEEEKVQRTYQLWEDPHIVNFVITNVENADADQRAGNQTAWKEYHDHKVQCDTWRDSDPERHEAECIRPNIIDRSNEDRSARVQARNDEAYAARQGEAYTISRTQEAAYRDNFRQAVTRNGRIEVAFETALDVHAELAKSDTSDRGEDQSTERQSYVPELANSNVRDSERQRFVRGSARFAEHMATQLGEDASVSVEFVEVVPDNAVQQREDGRIVVYIDIQELAETTNELAALEQDFLRENKNSEEVATAMKDIVETGTKEAVQKALNAIKNGAVSDENVSILNIAEENDDIGVLSAMRLEDENIILLASAGYRDPVLGLVLDHSVLTQIGKSPTSFVRDYTEGSHEIDSLENIQSIGLASSNLGIGRNAFTKLVDPLFDDTTRQEMIDSIKGTFSQDFNDGPFGRDLESIGNALEAKGKEAAHTIVSGIGEEALHRTQHYIIFPSTPADEDAPKQVYANVVGESLTLNLTAHIPSEGRYKIDLYGFNNWMTDRTTLHFGERDIMNLYKVSDYFAGETKDSSYISFASLPAGEVTFTLQGLHPIKEAKTMAKIILTDQDKNNVTHILPLQLVADYNRHLLTETAALTPREVGIGEAAATFVINGTENFDTWVENQEYRAFYLENVLIPTLTLEINNPNTAPERRTNAEQELVNAKTEHIAIDFFTGVFIAGEKSLVGDLSDKCHEFEVLTEILPWKKFQRISAVTAATGNTISFFFKDDVSITTPINFVVNGLKFAKSMELLEQISNTKKAVIDIALSTKELNSYASCKQELDERFRERLANDTRKSFVTFLNVQEEGDYTNVVLNKLGISNPRDHIQSVDHLLYMAYKRFREGTPTVHKEYNQIGITEKEMHILENDKLVSIEWRKRAALLDLLEEKERDLLWGIIDVATTYEKENGIVDIGSNIDAFAEETQRILQKHAEVLLPTVTEDQIALNNYGKLYNEMHAYLRKEEYKGLDDVKQRIDYHLYHLFLVEFFAAAHELSIVGK